MSPKQLLQSLREDWPTLLLLLALLEVSVGALAIADWVDGLHTLALIVAVGVVAGYLLAISRLRDGMTLLFSTAFGLFTVWLTSAGLITSQAITLRDKLADVAFRIAVWTEQAAGGGFSRDNLMFVLLLGVAFWFITYNACANTFREHNLWVAVIPPGLALLINHYYYFGPVWLEGYLIAYLFLTFTLAVRTNAAIREQTWRSMRVGFPPGIRFDLLRGGVIGAVVLLALAWLAPTAAASNPLASAWDRSINPWNRVQDTFSRLFGGVEGSGGASADYFGGATLSMGGPINLGSQTVMIVSAPPGYRYYWRSKLFDTYQNGRWITTSDQREQSDFGILPPEEATPYQLRVAIQQRFEIASAATRLVYAAPEAVSFSSLPVTFDVIYTAPGEEYASVTAVRAVSLLTEGRSYGVTSSISVADETSLREAGTDYPDWVTERYLQLPDTITQRTRDLAATLTASYNNPYDQARAIETYLRQNIAYNTQVPYPPSGAEPVDYFLFENPEGYCNYYASAMVVMLRSVGIPSRIAAGFTQGEPVLDGERDAYRVVESDAHSWVEVYFPNYGWIEFEPTTVISPITRPVARADRGGALPPGANQQLPDGGILEPTPIPTPDPAALPPLLPFEEAQTEEQAAARAALISTLRGIGFLAVLIGAAIAGGWFWLEQHGLRNLSAISRSYARMNIYAGLIGLGLPESATPHERARQIEGEVRDADAPISQITELYVAEQYGPPPLTPMHRDKDNEDARAAWRQLRAAFIRAGLRRLAARLIRPLRRKA